MGSVDWLRIARKHRSLIGVLEIHHRFGSSTVEFDLGVILYLIPGDPCSKFSGFLSKFVLDDEFRYVIPLGLTISDKNGGFLVSCGVG